LAKAFAQRFERDRIIVVELALAWIGQQRVQRIGMRGHTRLEHEARCVQCLHRRTLCAP
jgi:hypothetical protein